MPLIIQNVSLKSHPFHPHFLVYIENVQAINVLYLHVDAPYMPRTILVPCPIYSKTKKNFELASPALVSRLFLPDKKTFED